MKKDVFGFSSKIEKVNIDLSKSYFENIEKIARANQLSAYSIFLSCLYILLYNYTSQNVIDIALKKQINLEQSFSTLVKKVHESTPNTISNELSGNLSLAENSTPIDVMFTYRTISGNLLGSSFNNSKFDLHFEITLGLNSLLLEFNSDIFSKNTAKSLLAHYLFILKQIPQNLDCKLSDFEMVTPEEHKLLEKFDNTYSMDKFNVDLSLFNTEISENKIYILDKNFKTIPINTFR